MGRWLTIKQKRCIIEKSMQCPRMTHSELAGWATETFKLSRPLPRSTVSDAMKWCDEIWDEMQKTATIENCFRHTGIVFRGVTEKSKAVKGKVDSDVGVQEVTACASAMHF
ncbi:hypothetical protein JG687_00015995 [Phytophthora cactorum]|uniref:DDE-1 domain-containing protein n=1 Tax=Phytophthora cactorum TaxID=29920 RepID=A0A8T1TRU6_9STRA|nr:hypothetical protein JG687_00015995 [Phytophthora cactorum]